MFLRSQGKMPGCYKMIRQRKVTTVPVHCVISFDGDQSVVNPLVVILFGRILAFHWRCCS